MCHRLADDTPPSPARWRRFPAVPGRPFGWRPPRPAPLPAPTAPPPPVTALAPTFDGEPADWAQAAW